MYVAGEHEVQVSWKDSNAHADAIEGHQFVTGEFKFDKIVDCGSSGGGGNSGGGGDSGSGATWRLDSLVNGPSYSARHI